MSAKNHAVCPACGYVFKRPGFDNEIELAMHLLASSCLPEIHKSNWKSCWCGYGMFSSHFIGDQRHLRTHFASHGGVERHYIDCLMGCHR